ncbi:MAG: histidinol-phosphate transaminase [Zoogloeaceae bacterium]|nr:histidinol-phosphate transaminase [Zoogloeaceae bacterium]
MSSPVQAPANVRAIAPYQPGKPISELVRELGIPAGNIVKLASNENPLGMSIAARDAVRRCLGDVPRYPDGNGFALKQALSRRFGVDASQIVLGNGSNDVLDMAARAFLNGETSAVFSRYAFAVYPLATQTVGARGIEVPARDFGHDLKAMARAIQPDTRVIFIANPNNPTGTFLPGAAVREFLMEVPGDVLVVLDEAYTEYLGPADAYDAISWLDEFPNLLISRTFSKAYGLAGLRVGYGLGHPEVIDLLNRVRQPFNVSVLGLVAAEASLDDLEFIAKSAELNRRGMAQILAGLAELGLESIPSAGNFVTLRVGNAAAVNSRLLRQGVIVRPIAGYGLPDWLRVSIGLPEENTRFLAALRSALD